MIMRCRDAALALVAMGGVNPAAVNYFAKTKGGYGRIVSMPTEDAENPKIVVHDEFIQILAKIYSIYHKLGLSQHPERCRIGRSLVQHGWFRWTGAASSDREH